MGCSYCIRKSSDFNGIDYTRYEEDSKSRTDITTEANPSRIDNDKDSVEFRNFMDKEFMQLKQELANLKRGSKIPQRTIKKPEKSVISSPINSCEPNIEIKQTEGPTSDIEAKLSLLTPPQTLVEAPVESKSIKRSSSTRVFTTVSTRIDIVPDTSRKSPILSERVKNGNSNKKKSTQKLEISESLSMVVTPNISPSTRKSQQKGIQINELPQCRESPPRRKWKIEYPPQPLWNPGYNQYMLYSSPVYQYPMPPYNYSYHSHEPNSFYPPSTSPAPSHKDLHHSSRKAKKRSSRDTGITDGREEERTVDNKGKLIANESQEVREEGGIVDYRDERREFIEEKAVRAWDNSTKSKSSRGNCERIGSKGEIVINKTSISGSNSKRRIEEELEIESKESKMIKCDKKERERRDNLENVIDIQYSINKEKNKLKEGESDRGATDIEIINLMNKERDIYIEDQFIDKESKPALIEIGYKEQKTLADIFKEKNKKVVERIHSREDHIVKQDHKVKTKEELIEIRKNFVKASPKFYPKRADIIEVQFEENKSGKEFSSELMERLATGQRVKITKEEMIKLNKKNYKMLPEVKKRQEDDKKKLEKQQRIQNAKDYDKVRYIQNRQDKTKSKISA